MLEARNLHYAYVADQPVLQGISLTVKPNTVAYLLGHNGCGKTTLLEILGGVRAPQRGEVTLDGVNVPTLASVVAGNLYEGLEMPAEAAAARREAAELRETIATELPPNLGGMPPALRA